jgi:hypothetical protein
MWYIMSLAEIVQSLSPQGAIVGFQRSRLVVEPGVNHAAVVSRLMGRQSILSLNYSQLVAAEALAPGHFQCGGQADDTSPDNDGIEAGTIGHCILLKP